MYSDVKLIPLKETSNLIDISDEEYFSSKYAGYISNSALSLINPEQGGSPSKYAEGLSKNIQYSDSLQFGSAVHELILQPNDFFLVDEVDRPTAKLGLVADFLYDNFYSKSIDINDSYIKLASDTIGYYKGKMNLERIFKVLESCTDYWKSRLSFEQSYTGSKTPIYLDQASREKLKLCIDSFNSNDDIQNILHIGKPLNEQTILVDVLAKYKGKETVIKLKGKIDNFEQHNNSVVLNDLKTTGHWISQFEESFERYHYYRQMAMYLWLLSMYYHTNLDLSANMLLVSTVPEYKSGIFKVSYDNIQRGISEMRELLQRVAYCTIFNNFSDEHMETDL